MSERKALEPHLMHAEVVWVYLPFEKINGLVIKFCVQALGLMAIPDEC